jgi:hypothetical protein
MSVERESFKAAGMQCRTLGSNKAGKKETKATKGKSKYAIASCNDHFVVSRSMVSVSCSTHYSLLTVSSIILLLSTGTSDLSVPALCLLCESAHVSLVSHGFSPPFSHMRDASGERRPASSSSHDRAARIIPFHRSASERLPHLGRSIQRGLPP